MAAALTETFSNNAVCAKQVITIETELFGSKMSIPSTFESRRIGLCGSQRPPSSEFLAFCKAVGNAIATCSEATAVIAGRKLNESGEQLTADCKFVEGIREGLGTADVGDRLVTFRFRNEAHPDEYFQVGEVVEIGGPNRESRRLAMVHAVDAYIGIGGSHGTAQQLMFSFATGTPALPVPGFGGESARFWIDHRESLISQLQLTEEEAASWEATPTSAHEVEARAKRIVQCFLSSLRQRCFVIMPFAGDFSPLIDFVIDPSVREAGDDPIHLGRREEPGDVNKQITDGLATADYVICVLDGMRPNVLYELGMAHALRKPTILLWNRTKDKELKAPFDIAQEQRIEYDTIDHRLKPRLEKAIRFVKRRVSLTPIRG